MARRSLPLRAETNRRRARGPGWPLGVMSRVLPRPGKAAAASAPQVGTHSVPLALLRAASTSDFPSSSAYSPALPPVLRQEIAKNLNQSEPRTRDAAPAPCRQGWAECACGGGMVGVAARAVPVRQISGLPAGGPRPTRRVVRPCGVAWDALPKQQQLIKLLRTPAFTHISGV